MITSPPKENPWATLDTRSGGELVLGADRPYVDAFNEVIGVDPRFRLHTHLLPEPFTGPRNAPVVVLFLNPGVGGEEDQWHGTDEFGRAVEGMLRDDPTHHRHLGLDDRFADTGGGQWTRRAFKAVHEATGLSYDDLADRVLSVEFHGYHSRSWTLPPVTFPSQFYGFDLVGRAVERGAVVLAMRGRRAWTVAVPSLRSYAGLLGPPRNAQVSALSRRNLGEEAFEALVAALR